jgi:hypothetical protein
MKKKYKEITVSDPNQSKTTISWAIKKKYI